MLRISGYPAPIRRFLWWSTLHVSGPKRAKRLGTFGLSSYGALGAESYHPISPLTTTLTYGPIDPDGRVTVKLIYDHRVLDGAEVARRLGDLEATLLGPILDELPGPAAGSGRDRPDAGSCGVAVNRRGFRRLPLLGDLDLEPAHQVLQRLFLGVDEQDVVEHDRPLVGEK